MTFLLSPEPGADYGN